MHTFQITIQRWGDGFCPVIAEEHREGGQLPVRVEGELRLDQNELLATELDRAAYGHALGAALFAGPVRDAFIEALARTDELLRVLLFIEDVPMRGLRWERLFAPIDGGWKLLATFQRTPFSRYLPSLTDRRFPPIGRRDLRALVVASSPASGNRFQLEPFDVAAATAGVRTALGPIPTTLLADIDGADGRPTLDELCAQITAAPATILHLVCHGRVLKDGEALLFLAGNDGPGSIDPVTGTRLLERLSSLEGARGLPHFAFLSTCESASPDADEAMGGLGQRLVRELGMPAVVAMTDKVSIVTANALSAAIYQRLREHGEPDRALVEGAVRLAERGDVMVPVLFSRLGGQPLFSDTLDRALTPAELTAGLDALADALPDRAPVLVGEFGQAAATLRRSLDSRPDLLSAEARHRRAEAMSEIEAICAEATGIGFQSLCLGEVPPPYDARCPFPGLRSFKADARAFFFGREPLVARLLARMDETPFLAVLGPSGSGKSSAVFAGLVPALQARRPELALLSLTPGDLPLASLLYTLEQARPTPASDGGPAVAQGILVIDQFEEAFTLCQDADERREFFAELLRQSGRYLVIITMRADFLGEVAPYPHLRDRVTAYQELIAPMTPEELRRAMELQAAAVGLRFEADLGGQILDDVRGEPGAMPLLQHALQELWQRRRGYWLRGAEYRAIGGIQQAIAHSADEIYDGAMPEEQERLRAIFVRLTRLDSERAEGQQRDTRQRVALAELVPAGADPALTRALVGRLADARLLVTGVGPAGEETAEVAHEALIRSWPRLRAWLSEDRQGLLLREAIHSAAREWAASGQDEGFLFRGARLDEAAALAQQPRFALNAQEQQFLDAAVALRAREAAEKEAARQRELKAAQDLANEQSRRADEAAAAAARQRQLSRFMTGIAVAAGVAALAALGFWGQANYQQGRSQANADSAQQQAATAVAANAAAQAQQQTAVAANAAAQAQQQTAVAARSDADTSRATAVNKALQAAAQSAMSEGDLSLAIMLGREIVERNPSDADAKRFLSEAAYSPGIRREISFNPDLIPAAVSVFAVSPDGKLVATGHINGTLAIWNLSDGSLASRTAAEGGAVQSVAFSPDGSSLAVARDQRGITIQYLSSERDLGATAGGRSVLSLAYSPDGKLLAAASEGGQIDLWEAISGQVAITFQSRGPVSCLAFSPDGRELITGGFDGVATVWDARSGAEIVRLDGGVKGGDRGNNGERVRHSDKITSVAFSPDGNLAVTGSIDKTIGIWNIGQRARAALGFLTGHTASITSVEISPNGQQIISASDDGTVRLWSLLGLREQLRLEAHVFGAIGAFYLPGGQAQAVSVGNGGVLRVWDLIDGREVKRAYAPGAADSVALSSDGTLALVASSNGIQSFGIATGDISTTQKLTIENPALPAVAALTSDGNLAAIGGADGSITLWNPRTGVTLGTLAGHTDKITALAFSPDGTQLASGAFDNTMRVWSVADRSPTSTVELSNPSNPNRSATLLAAAWSPDGGTLLVGTSEGAWLWDVASGTTSAGGNWPTSPTMSVAWSADGLLAAVGGSDRTATVIKAASGVVQNVLEHRGPIRGIAFTADGARLITAAEDRRITLWDLSDSGEVQHISVADTAVSSMATDSAVDIIVTGSNDGAMRIWSFADLADLSVWVDANRYVPTLTDEQRALLGIE